MLSNLSIKGSAIYLYGNASCPYDIALDSSVFQHMVPNGSDLLFSNDGLSYGAHVVKMTARPSPNSGQQFAFDRAIVSDAVLEG